VLAPVNLSALAGRKREREERGLAWRSNNAQVVFDDREAARVTGFLQPLEDLHAAIRMALDESTHRRLVLIELAASARALPRPIALRLEPALHRARIERHRLRDLRDAQTVLAVKVLDAAKRLVVDHRRRRSELELELWPQPPLARVHFRRRRRLRLVIAPQ